MKPCKSIIMVIISMFFVVSLCSQAWARKAAPLGSSPSNMSISHLKQGNWIKVKNESRLDISPKFVESGDTLGFGGYLSCNQLNQHIEDPEKHLKPGDKVTVVVAEKAYTKKYPWGAYQIVTCPGPEQTVNIYNRKWTAEEPYVVPDTAQPGQIFTFRLGIWLVFGIFEVAESSVKVKGISPGVVPPEKLKHLKQKGQ